MNRTGRKQPPAVFFQKFSTKLYLVFIFILSLSSPYARQPLGLSKNQSISGYDPEIYFRPALYKGIGMRNPTPQEDVGAIRRRLMQVQQVKQVGDPCFLFGLTGARSGTEYRPCNRVFTPVWYCYPSTPQSSSLPSMRPCRSGRATWQGQAPCQTPRSGSGRRFRAWQRPWRPL